MHRLASVVLALFLVGCAVQQPNYPPDAQSMDVPAEAAAIVTVPEYPTAGRVFEIKQTPGIGDTLKVLDQHGKLEILQGSQHLADITLGPCLSFASMNDQHDFGAQGKPEYATTPADCRVWNGRRWNESFKTQTRYYRNPCLYEGRFSAAVTPSANGDKTVDTTGEVEGVILDNGKSFSFTTRTMYDDDLKFFQWFNVGYVGTIRVLKEVK